MTHKAVANAIVQAHLAKDPHGMRRLLMDNRYLSPLLFILLREKFDILCAGTIHSNRIGWPTEKMTLSKSAGRGQSLVKYDAHNKIMCIQWVDNKVVSCLSTLQLSDEDVCARQSRSNVLNLSVP